MTSDDKAALFGCGLIVLVIVISIVYEVTKFFAFWHIAFGK